MMWKINKIVNNTRFLIFPWVKINNLASKALSVAAKRISSDWKDRYGFEPVLLETFVDVAFYKGTCYQAANWVEIGMTSGRGRMDRHTHIYLLLRRFLFIHYTLTFGCILLMNQANESVRLTCLT
ncbi:MAG: Druantia anti-phage system protein DruA [Paenibacillaceae bacterium]